MNKLYDTQSSRNKLLYTASKLHRGSNCLYEYLIEHEIRCGGFVSDVYLHVLRH
jgi:hypothetical protein